MSFLDGLLELLATCDYISPLASFLDEASASGLQHTYEIPRGKLNEVTQELEKKGINITTQLLGNKWNGTNDSFMVSYSDAVEVQRTLDSMQVEIKNNNARLW